MAVQEVKEALALSPPEAGPLKAWLAVQEEHRAQKSNAHIEQDIEAGKPARFASPVRAGIAAGRTRPL